MSAVAGVLLLQGVIGSSAAGVTEVTYTRYERAIEVPVKAEGQTCVVLDAAVLEHTANRAGNDLRLYAGEDAEARETPFALTESSSTPGDAETVSPSGERVQGSVVAFDLRMPDRPYSEIDLGVDGKDFIAIAQVTGSAQEGSGGKTLGTVTVFDFSSEGLPRSTQLQLGESSEPWVHVKLSFLDARGKPLGRRAPVVTEASIPPSRQGQILYTTVAETRAIAAGATGSDASLEIGAHVPVERVRVEPGPAFKADFLGTVRVTARSRQPEAGGGGEVFEGGIGRVTRLDPGPGVPPIRFEQLTVGAALGSNLRSEATVRVRVAGGSGGALPVTAVILEMRRRSLCFEARPGLRYVLRYGDELLPAPLYAYARTFRPGPAFDGVLGPERVNPGFVARDGRQGWIARSPELVWVALLAVVTLAGAVVLERLRGSRHG